IINKKEGEKDYAETVNSMNNEDLWDAYQLFEELDANEIYQRLKSRGVLETLVRPATDAITAKSKGPVPLDLVEVAIELYLEKQKLAEERRNQ
ncbi:MAG: hypothetical protein HY602_00830, partial [Parcubacteria group bacterium]|nr:hypothetical protein [Parcubacteria group bacterium]